MSLSTPLLHRGGRLLRETRGVATIEFAFTLPIVTLIAMTGIEYANLAMAHVRVSQIAETVADNAARVNNGIDESDINEVFSGARQIGASMDFAANGRIVLSSLQENGYPVGDARRGQMINWQRCTGSLAVTPAYGVQGRGRNDATLQAMGAAGRQITSLQGTAVMFVEVTYQYRPLISSRLIGNARLRYENAFNVRERTQQDITNTQGLPLNSC